eukprot:CAMPEP_0204566722 /NCGR_PEP_ID=MMETSP0661-20131031/36205_1 /ASSEMBLY_ACC=CAM_ASM_000606 /TAXON_ID=109239 /ORGANISM="Alexandrium margalefi, Strain AMGDE01CS-322" /LENGTH=58 /DNA_ID=CAMNT_0051574583 /DNA_START=192 /DNA_END=365 /DNA_ORIENTATION=+
MFALTPSPSRSCLGLGSKRRNNSTARSCSILVLALRKTWTSWSFGMAALFHHWPTSGG